MIIKPNTRSRVITAEVHFMALSDKEKEGINEGFCRYMNKKLNHSGELRESFELLEFLNPLIQFYKSDGKDRFTIKISRTILSEMLGQS